MFLNSEVTIHTLPDLKCMWLFSMRSSLPFINIGVRIELTFIKSGNLWPQLSRKFDDIREEAYF